MGLENKDMDLCGRESETDLGRPGEDGEYDQTTLYGTLKELTIKRTSLQLLQAVRLSVVWAATQNHARGLERTQF